MLVIWQVQWRTAHICSHYYINTFKRTDKFVMYRKFHCDFHLTGDEKKSSKFFGIGNKSVLITSLLINWAGFQCNETHQCIQYSVSVSFRRKFNELTFLRKKSAAKRNKCKSLLNARTPGRGTNYEKCKYDKNIHSDAAIGH